MLMSTIIEERELTPPFFHPLFGITNANPHVDRKRHTGHTALSCLLKSCAALRNHPISKAYRPPVYPNPYSVEMSDGHKIGDAPLDRVPEAIGYIGSGTPYEGINGVKDAHR